MKGLVHHVCHRVPAHSDAHLEVHNLQADKGKDDVVGKQELDTDVPNFAVPSVLVQHFQAPGFQVDLATHCNQTHL